MKKINFTQDTNLNHLVYDDKKFKKKELKIALFNQPEVQDYITIFVLINKLNKTTHAQLANCIASIRLQTFSNIKICIINSDTNIKAKYTIKQLANQTDSSVIEATANIKETLDELIKETKSKYISIIDCTDIIPRTNDIEECVKILHKYDYDYLSHIITYENITQTNDNHEYQEKSVLKSSFSEHYGAFFKTSKLKNYKFTELKRTCIDEAMIINFEKNKHNGNHLISETDIQLIGFFTETDVNKTT